MAVKQSFYFGDTVIPSRTGFHQGEPLTPFLFSLTLWPIMKMIKEQVPALCANDWYLDDGALAGSVQEIQHVIDILQTHGPERGVL